MSNIASSKPSGALAVVGSFLLSMLVLGGCASTNEPSQSQASQTDSAATKETVKQPLSLEQVCEQGADCRTNASVYLASVQGEVKLEYDQYWPVVYEGEIRLLPGERVLVEIEFDESRQANVIRQVQERSNPEQTFELFFAQVRGNYGMLMSFRNPMTQPVQFDVEITGVSGQQHRLNTCPIRGGMSFHERWPEPAKELILKQPRIVNEPSNGVMICSS